MSVKVEATFKDRRVKKFMKDISNNLKDADKKKQFYSFLGIEVFADIIDHFENEEGPNGPWQQRSEPYKSIIEGKGFTKILQVTGNLRQGFQPIQGGGNLRKTSDGILWFNKAKTSNGFPYAAAHDEGTAKLPQRKFMWLSQKRLDKMGDLILKKVLGVK